MADVCADCGKTKEQLGPDNALGLLPSWWGSQFDPKIHDPGLVLTVCFLCRQKRMAGKRNA